MAVPVVISNDDYIKDEMRDTRPSIGGMIPSAASGGVSGIGRHSQHFQVHDESVLSDHYRRVRALFWYSATSLAAGKEGRLLEIAREQIFAPSLGAFWAQLEPIPPDVFDHNPAPPRRHFTVPVELHFRGRAPALPIDDPS